MKNRDSHEKIDDASEALQQHFSQKANKISGIAQKSLLEEIINFQRCQSLEISWFQVILHRLLFAIVSRIFLLVSAFFDNTEVWHLANSRTVSWGYFDLNNERALVISFSEAIFAFLGDILSLVW